LVVICPLGDSVRRLLLRAQRAAATRKVHKSRSRSPTRYIVESMHKPADAFVRHLAQGVGPKGALHRLSLESLDTAQRLEWVEGARVNAILGSCRLSLKSVVSGIRAFKASAGVAACAVLMPGLPACACAEHVEPGQRLFPPKLKMLLAWTTLFRSAGTLSNYLGYVRTGCLLCEASVEVHT